MIFIRFLQDVILNDAENKNSDPYQLFSSPKRPVENIPKTYRKPTNVQVILANADNVRK